MATMMPVKSIVVSLVAIWVATLSLADEACGQISSPADINSYLQSVQTSVRKHWFPPKYSAPVDVAFEVHRNGDLSGLHLVNSSGSELIDHVSLMAVQDAAPFDPLPSGFQSETVPVRLHFPLLSNESVPNSSPPTEAKKSSRWHKKRINPYVGCETAQDYAAVDQAAAMRRQAAALEGIQTQLIFHNAFQPWNWR